MFTLFDVGFRKPIVVVVFEGPFGKWAHRVQRELQIARFYRAVLDREPDEAGMAYWYRLLTTGTDITTIADSFAVSTEFEARFGVPPGASGDPEFLRQVYRNVLDRDPDLAGERYWAQLLAAGVPRAQVVLWFCESQEFLSASGLAPADLPPFESEVLEITADDLGVSWRPGCPVSPRDLRLLRLRFVDFAGSARDGELVVHTDVADDIVIVFERLYLNRYPIESMRTVDEFGGSDDASMAANNTSAFNCRAAVSSTSWSRHAYGTAIDINPLINPYVTSSTVLPPTGADFADRQHRLPLFRQCNSI